MKIITFLFLLSFLFFIPISCTKNVKKDVIKNQIVTPKDFSIPLANQLTFKGENSKGILSADKSQLLFISQNRENHKNAQIYLKDQVSQKVKRVTYHDGDVYDLTFGKTDKEIFYSSTTDEIKENSTYINEALRHLNQETEPLPQPNPDSPITEIYKSDLDGHVITRITHSEKFDGDMDYFRPSNSLRFTSLRSGNLQIYFFKGHRWNKPNPMVLPALKNLRSPRVSPDGRLLAFVHKSDTSYELQISRVNGTKNSVLFKSNYEIKEPIWSPDGSFLVFSSNFIDDNFELFQVTVKDKCIKRLTYHTAKDTYPYLVSPTEMVFTSDRSGAPQIYIRTLGQPKTCLPNNN